MDWMHTHQLSSKNLTAGEKLAMTMELQKEIALENEKKKSEAISESNRNRNSNTLQLECNENESKSRSNTWTDSQTAKKAGVGVGTVARYNRVMNSDEAKQRKVAVEYVKLCGYKNGEIGRNHIQDSHNGKAEKLTLEEIAKQLGTSKTNLTRALTIERNLTEPMKKLLDDGVISKTDRQRKSGNVLRNWKDCMESKEEIISIAYRILRYPLNPT